MDIENSNSVVPFTGLPKANGDVRIGAMPEALVPVIICLVMIVAAVIGFNIHIRGCKALGRQLSNISEKTAHRMIVSGMLVAFVGGPVVSIVAIGITALIFHLMPNRQSRQENKS